MGIFRSTPSQLPRGHAELMADGCPALSPHPGLPPPHLLQNWRNRSDYEPTNRKEFGD